MKARDEARKWFESREQEIKDKMKVFNEELEQQRKLVSELSSTTQQLFGVELDDLKRAKGAAIRQFNMESIQIGTDIAPRQANDIDDIRSVDAKEFHNASKNQLEKNKTSDELDSSSVQAYIDRLKDKPKDGFNDYDYFVTGADYFNKFQFGSALDSINMALEKVKPESRVDRITYLNSKANILEKLKYYAEAQKILSDLINKFEQYPDEKIQELVAQSAYQNMTLLRKMKRFEEVSNVYSNFLRRYKSHSSEKINQIVARTIFDQAVYLKEENNLIDAICNYDLIIDKYSNNLDDNLGMLTMVSRIHRDSAINQFIKAPEAVDYYAQKIEKYKQLVAEQNTKENRVKLIEGLTYKAEALRAQKLEDDALTIYSEVIELFKQQSDSEVNYLIAGAFNAVGFASLLKAKQNWADFDQRSNLLDFSLNNFESALKLSNDHNRPVILGNNGYTLFLLNRKDDARIVTEECLKQGGINALKTQLVDAKIDRVVAVDSAYEEWIKELSANLNLPNLEHL